MAGKSPRGFSSAESIGEIFAIFIIYLFWKYLKEKRLGILEIIAFLYQF